jgi:hypothetical protein
MRKRSFQRLPFSRSDSQTTPTTDRRLKRKKRENAMLCLINKPHPSMIIHQSTIHPCTSRVSRIHVKRSVSRESKAKQQDEEKLCPKLKIN